MSHHKLTGKHLKLTNGIFILCAFVALVKARGECVMHLKSGILS